MGYRSVADGAVSKGKTKGKMLAKGGMAKAPKESKAMMKKEVDFMKKKGAPKSMIKHEMAEAKMRKGGRVCK